MIVLAIDCKNCGCHKIQKGKRWRVGVKTYPVGVKVLCPECGALVEVIEEEFITWQEREGLE